MKERDYQEETINRVINNYNRNIKRNLCVLGTGLGKTFIATGIHKRFKPEKKTLFLVDRIELADQAAEAFEESNTDLIVGIEMNQHKAPSNADVIVACVATIGRKGSYRIGKFKPEDFSLVIVDEAHGSVNESFIRVLNYLGVGPDNFDKDKLLVGLTATPNRPDKVSLGLLFDEITVNYDLIYGIQNGWLTELEHIPVKTKVNLKNISFTDSTIQKVKELNTDYRNEIILKSYIQNSYGENAIVYCHSVEHAHAVAGLFNAYGISSFCIEANTDKDLRKEKIAEYKRGDILVLTNFGTLTTGFNAPETTTIILARPIKSDLLLRQIIGRGVRTSQNCFIDFLGSKESRLNIINKSVKPACKIIDLHDDFNDNRIVSVPSLFGLAPDFETEGKKKLYKEVVEPLYELKMTKNIDISTIKNLNEIELIVEKRRVNVKSLKVPIEIEDFTSNPWLPIGKHAYEIIYNENKKTLIIEENQLNKWEVVEFDHKRNLAKKLNEFHDLSAAFKLADDYAGQFYDNEWVESDQTMAGKGVTKGQYGLLKRLYKGGIGVSKYETYRDTGVPVLFFRNTGNERLDRSLANRLIRERVSR